MVCKLKQVCGGLEMGCKFFSLYETTFVSPFSFNGTTIVCVIVKCLCPGRMGEVAVFV